MQTKKMSLANIKGKLSRAEMKNIMAGSGGGQFDCTEPGECPTWIQLSCNGVMYDASASCRNGKCIYAVVC